MEDIPSIRIKMESQLFTNLDLLTLVAEYTDKRDHVSYLRVSRSFYRVFIKYVWIHVDVGRLASFKGSAVKLFEDHQESIRELSLLGRTSPGYFPLRKVACTTPKEIARDSLKEPVLRLLASPTSRIESLTIVSSVIPRNWLVALSKHPTLRTLQLHGDPEMTVMKNDDDIFLRACGRVQTLSLSHIRLPTWPLNHRQGIDTRFDFSNVQHLTIGLVGIGDVVVHDYVQQLLVRQCVNLRSLRYQFLQLELELAYSRLHLATMLQDIGCFNDLHTIDVSGLSLRDWELAYMISGLTQLRSLKVAGSQFGQCSVEALLRKRKDDNESTIPGRSDIDHIGRPCETLEVFELDSCNVYDPIFSVIASNCSRLLKLRFGFVRPQNILRETKWGFLSLTSLELKFLMRPSLIDVNAQAQWRAIAKRISQLQQLEKLGLKGTS